MLRRRRPSKNEAMQFSFDSFLDLVTNVVGIIIRLILVTWVGARSYHASMQWVDAEPATPVELLPPPKLTSDPLYTKLEIARHEIEEAKARLTAQIKELDAVEQKAEQTHAQIATLASRRVQLESESKTLQAAKAERSARVQLVSLSASEIRQRTQKLLQEIRTLEGQPVNKKQLKYHAPVSSTVHSEELFFECKNGRVTFIDIPAFLLEIKQSLESIADELKTQWQVERTTAPVGPYRLRYVVEREKTILNAGSGFRYGLSTWVVEPVTAEHGETLTAALAPKSAFRQFVDPLDANLTVVTFWVYPDSFELFRQLRDYLYERGLDVAGRPLPPGAPIAASKHGTASRGQ